MDRQEKNKQTKNPKLTKNREQQNLSIDFAFLTQAFRIQGHHKVVEVQALECYQETRSNL